jgi:hypothetical protein
VTFQLLAYQAKCQLHLGRQAQQGKFGGIHGGVGFANSRSTSGLLRSTLRVRA